MDAEATLKEQISGMLRDEDLGFEVFVALKTGEVPVRRLLFYGDNEKGNFKRKIQDTIVQTVKDKFLGEETEYIDAVRLADNQKKFYVITQTEQYYPFDFLNTPEEMIDGFSASECGNADGIIFRFRRENKVIWAYQRIYPIAIPNRKKQNIMARFVSTEKADYFVEMPDQLFTITQQVDLLIIDDKIITDNTTLMQKHFKFDYFIKSSAEKAVETIIQIHLVSNGEKLKDYIQRSKPQYARKMMRINEYNVVNQKPEELLEKIQGTDRWKDVFQIEAGKIHLNTYADVEYLIDLFDERYTVSEITGDEFDTDVKKLVETESK